MTRELARILAALHTERQVETAASTWETMPEWVFYSEVGGALHPRNRAIVYFMDRCSWENKSQGSHRVHIGETDKILTIRQSL
jgi:hypothetical protein